MKKKTEHNHNLAGSQGLETRSARSIAASRPRGANKNFHHRTHTLQKAKYLVKSRYLADGTIEVFAPKKMTVISQECGWISHECPEGYEWTDYFSSQSGADRFIEDLWAEFPEVIKFIA